MIPLDRKALKNSFLVPAPTASVRPSVVWPTAFAVPGQCAMSLQVGLIDSSGIAALQKSHTLVLSG